jgi:hypothetical protein
MPRTPTAPPDDKSCWRRVLAAVHPDSGGDHETFVWLQNVRESLCSCGSPDSSRRREGSSPVTPSATVADEQPDRIPYDPHLGAVEEFGMLTRHALSVGQRAGYPYRGPLSLLVNCPVDDHGRGAASQGRGATYKQLALISHRLGWSKSERSRWYDPARSVPLSERHANHIIGKISGKRAA